MNNIIKNMIDSVVFIVLMVILGIVVIITVNDIVTIFATLGVLLFLIALSALFVVPCLKDLKHKETTTFEGVFLRDVDLGTQDYYFFDIKGNGKEGNYYRRPGFIGNKYLAERGKRYRVVIYKHSHTIYSLELLE